MRPHHSRRLGFTLIELLVAISILAIVAVLGWRGLDSIVRARVALTAQIEATRGMQLAFAQMQSDVEHIADTGLLQGHAYMAIDANRMTMIRAAYRENEAALLQVVAYRVVDGVLLRRESASTRDLIQLDAMWKVANSNTDSTAPVALQSGINGMTVEVWENNRWNAGTQMVGAVPNALATGVQVSLQAKDVQAVMIKSFLLGGL
jgi:general secretion pathway protein J